MINQSIVRTIIVLAVIENSKLQYLDIKTTFLNDKLDKEIYIILLVGFKKKK